MTDLRKRLTELDESLSAFDAATYPSWQLGEIFNALLIETKEECKGDPIVKAISPVTQQQIPLGIEMMAGPPTDAHAGSIRAAVKQMVAACGGRPSAST